MGVDFSGSHKAMDASAHERTYGGFVKVTSICTIMALMVLAMMAIVLL